MIKRSGLRIVAALIAAGLVIAGCTPGAPAPTPTKAPAAPTKAAEPTKAPAAPTAAPAAPTKAAEPTKAPASQPTAAPAKKVDYPQKGKAITLIVSWDAGGITDILARQLAAAMEKELGTPVQVVNKPGGAAQIGHTEIAKSKPDGYTFGSTNLPSSFLSYLDPQRKAAYGRGDLMQVSNVLLDPASIAVKADSPFKTLKDLIDAAKASPEKVKISDNGALTGHHLDNLMLEKLAGVKFAIVHFSGGAPAVAALLGGHIDASVSVAGQYAPQVKSGEIRLLAVMAEKESKFFPGVPTLESQGYKYYSASSSLGFSVAGGTPREIVDFMDGAIKKITDSDDFKKKMDELSYPLYYMNSARFTAFWDEKETEIKPLLELARK